MSTVNSNPTLGVTYAGSVCSPSRQRRRHRAKQLRRVSAGSTILIRRGSSRRQLSDTGVPEGRRSDK
jgi:hypothetical protein